MYATYTQLALPETTTRRWGVHGL